MYNRTDGSLDNSRPERGLDDLQGGDARAGAETRPPRQGLLGHLRKVDGQRDRTLKQRNASTVTCERASELVRCEDSRNGERQDRARQ